MKDEFANLEDVSVLKDGGTTENKGKVQAKNDNFVFAAVLILVGIALAFSVLTGYTLTNWWALFILIPVSTMTLNLWQDYQENGRFTKKSSYLIGPIIIQLVLIPIFLFNLSWSIIWPAGVIAVGASMLLAARSS